MKYYTSFSYSICTGWLFLESGTHNMCWQRIRGKNVFIKPEWALSSIHTNTQKCLCPAERETVVVAITTLFITAHSQVSRLLYNPILIPLSKSLLRLIENDYYVAIKNFFGKKEVVVVVETQSTSRKILYTIEG